MLIDVKSRQSYVIDFASVQQHGPVFNDLSKAIREVIVHDWKLAGPGFAATEYYNDFYRPCGWHACGGLILQNEHDSWACVSFHRAAGQPIFGDDTRSDLAPVAGHLRRALFASEQARELRRRASVVESALDAIDTAVWIVDGSCTIRLRNEAAKQVEKSNAVVAGRGGRLQVRLAGGAAQELAAAVQRAADVRSPAGSWVSVGTAVLTVLPLSLNESAGFLTRERPVAVLLKVGGPIAGIEAAAASLRPDQAGGEGRDPCCRG